MRKNVRVGQPVTSPRPVLQHLDGHDPRLHLAAAHGPRYRVIHGRIVIDTIGMPTPPPPPPGDKVNQGDGWEAFWC